MLCRASSYSLFCSFTLLLMMALPRPDASFFPFATLLLAFGFGFDRSGAPGCEHIPISNRSTHIADTVLTMMKRALTMCLVRYNERAQSRVQAAITLYFDGDAIDHSATLGFIRTTQHNSRLTPAFVHHVQKLIRPLLDGLQSCKYSSVRVPLGSPQPASLRHPSFHLLRVHTGRTTVSSR